MEDLAFKKGQCLLHTDLLSAFRDEILEGCRQDLHSVVTLVRQEVDRSIRQIAVQVRRCVRDQSADSLNLIAEMGRVRNTEYDLTEVLREVQEDRGGMSSELLDTFQQVRGLAEASSEGLQSVKSAMSSMIVRQGNVEEGVSEMNTAVRRVMAEVAEIRKVKTEMEFRNVREKKIEAEVADILREVKELKTSLEASGLARPRGHGEWQERGPGSAAANAEGLEAQLRRALKSGDHLGALRGEVQEALRRLAAELDSRGGAAVAGAMESVTSTFQAQLADVVREVRGIKADVDLKIIREGATRDVKIFVSTAPREEEGQEEESRSVGLAGGGHPQTAKRREGGAAGRAPGRGQSSGSLASTAASAALAGVTAPELSVSTWTDSGGAEDSRRTSSRPASASQGRLRQSQSPLREADIAALRAVFDRVDVNGSGSISMIETIKALRTDERFAQALGFAGTVWVRQEDGTRDAFMRVFNRVDLDSDSTISWEELVAAAAAACQPGSRGAPAATPPDRETLPPDRSAPRNAVLEDSEASFSHEEEYHGSIVDGFAVDRAISRARGVATALACRGNAVEDSRAEERPNPCELGPDEKAALRCMFDRVDANGSGMISMTETIKALRVDDRFARVLGFDGAFRVRQEDGTREAFCRAFQQVDTDGDNNITWAELQDFAVGQREKHLAGGAPLLDRPGASDDPHRAWCR
uniref:EF-hand domain-containing protein n=1 Tax=Alexandrium monilatum TaxID=311494 RepID=A0A7S4SL61_9DINO